MAGFSESDLDKSGVTPADRPDPMPKAEIAAIRSRCMQSTGGSERHIPTTVDDFGLLQGWLAKVLPYDQRC